MGVKWITFNLSNLVWTSEAGKENAMYSVLLAQDIGQFAPVDKSWNDKYCWIYYGAERIEYGLSDVPMFLAVIQMDTTYTLKRVEYFETRNGLKVFDVMRLSSKMNGLHFTKAVSFMKTSKSRRFNRRRENVLFYPVIGKENTWVIEKEE